MLKKKTELAATCEDLLDYAMDFHDIPGLALGVMVGDETYTSARGYRNFTTKAPLAANHIFHCVSLSKLFTSMGIMKLVEKGRLVLEDRLVDVAPYLSIADKRWEKITIRQMLSHTSGLADVTDYHWERAETDDDALRRYALSEEISEKTLLWEPGEGGFRYSNIAYELLGLVIEEVSGETYEGFMSSALLKPSGMEHSTFLTFERTGGSPALDDIDAAGLAMPHRKDRQRNIVLEGHYPYSRSHAPSSTLTSNVHDLLKWAEANMERRLLKDSTYDMIWQTHARVQNNGEEMGLGWFMREQSGYKLFGHEGMDDGFRAGLWICPELKTATVLLCNMADSPVKRLGKQLFEKLLRMQTTL